MTGSDTVRLDGAGERYFICGAPGHCAAGMKLQVRVSDAECTRTMPPPGSPGAPGELADPFRALRSVPTWHILSRQCMSM